MSQPVCLFLINEVDDVCCLDCRRFDLQRLTPVDGLGKDTACESQLFMGGKLFVIPSKFKSPLLTSAAFAHVGLFCPQKGPSKVSLLVMTSSQ